MLASYLQSFKQILQRIMVLNVLLKRLGIAKSKEGSITCDFSSQELSMRKVSTAPVVWRVILGREYKYQLQ